MGVQYDWRDEDWEAAEGDGWSARRPRRRREWYRSGFLAFVLMAGLVLLVAWGWQRRQHALDQADLRASLQAILDAETEALAAGDPARFFASATADPAWRAAQLAPDNQAVVRAGRQVIRAEQQGGEIWAEVTWTVDGVTQRRLEFFATDGRRRQHTGTAPHYWGPRRSTATPWGALVVRRADEPFSPAVVDHVTSRLPTLCPEDCPAFSLVLNEDLTASTQSGVIQVPSPHLVGLDQAGQPGPAFWAKLDAALADQLSPVTVRFAVHGSQQAPYEELADRFTALEPRIRVEVIPFDELPETDAALLAAVDALAFPPINPVQSSQFRNVTLAPDLLSAGLLRDLDHLIASDPGFAPGDFYEQVWQGTQWQDRTWLVPQGAFMPVIFYDLEAYRLTGREAPLFRWTWAEMLLEVQAMSEAQPASIQWGLMDPRLELLYAFAYSQDGRCNATFTVHCQRPLNRTTAVAALNWYLSLLAPGDAPGLLLDLSQLPARERQRMTLQRLSSNRQIALWVEDPSNFEMQFLLDVVGVLPFPASEQFDSVTPLWVQGSAISAFSPRPVAAWRWLSFLSHQSLQSQLRHIPARPSAAERNGYWTNLPRPLQNAMRSAFPFARPVPLAEQGTYTWDRLGAHLRGELSLAEAAAPPQPRWFRAGPAEGPAAGSSN